MPISYKIKLGDMETGEPLYSYVSPTGNPTRLKVKGDVKGASFKTEKKTKDICMASNQGEKYKAMLAKMETYLKNENE